MKKYKYYSFIILFLILMQPIFDVWTFWVLKSESNNYVVYLRSIIMLVLPIMLLIYRKLNRWIIVISGLYAVYILSQYFLVGNIVGGYEIYEVEKAFRVFFAPLFTIWLIIYSKIHPQKSIIATWRALSGVALISIVIAFLSLITGTNHYTYSKRWINAGLNGWFYSSNAQSIILYTTLPFLVFYLLSIRNRYLKAALMISTWLLLYLNGTRVAYLSLFFVFFINIVFVYLKDIKQNARKININKNNVFNLSILAVALSLSFILFPFSLTANITNNRFAVIQNRDRSKPQVEEPKNTRVSDADGRPIPCDSDDIIDSSIDNDMRKWIDNFIPGMISNSLIEEKIYGYYRNVPTSRLVDKRFVQKSFVNIVMSNSGVYRQIFGYGSKWYQLQVDDIETDYAAIYGFYGILGLVLFFGPFIYLLITTAMMIIQKKNYKILINPYFVIPGLILISLFGIAFMAGRALQQPSTSVYIAIMTMLLYIVACLDGRQNFQIDESIRNDT